MPNYQMIMSGISAIAIAIAIAIAEIAIYRLQFTLTVNTIQIYQKINGF